MSDDLIVTIEFLRPLDLNVRPCGFSLGCRHLGVGLGSVCQGSVDLRASLLKPTARHDHLSTGRVHHRLGQLDARGCLLDHRLGGDGHQRDAVLCCLLLGNGRLQDGTCLRQSYCVVMGGNLKQYIPLLHLLIVSHIHL